MPTKKVTKVDKERLEILCWQLSLYDNRRSSLENRAAITVSISAVLFGGYLFLVQQTLSEIPKFSPYIKFSLITLVLITIVILALSLVYSTLAIANVHRTSHQTHGLRMPKRLFFYPRETFAILGDFKSYQEHYIKASDEEMMTYMLGELWVISKEYQDRYNHLRWAIRLLLISIVAILASVVFVLLNS